MWKFVLRKIPGISELEKQMRNQQQNAIILVSISLPQHFGAHLKYPEVYDSPQAVTCAAVPDLRS